MFLIENDPLLMNSFFVKIICSLVSAFNFSSSKSSKRLLLFIHSNCVAVQNQIRLIKIYALLWVISLFSLLERILVEVIRINEFISFYMFIQASKQC